MYLPSPDEAFYLCPMSAPDWITLIDYLGTLAFAISGATLAIQKRFDLFGVFVLAFVTAIGGGTIRDMLIGQTPVTWMHAEGIIVTIIGGAVVALLLYPYMHKLNYFVYLFDSAGLGLFSLVGIQQGIAHDLNIFICISLGTISATFGGLLRDIITGEPPMLLTRKEIYAIASATGGGLYFLLRAFTLPDGLTVPIAVLTIFMIRHITRRLGITLPTLRQPG